MTPLVALLTLAAASSTAPPLDGVASMEQVRLPPVSGPLTLRVDLLERTLVLEAPKDAAAIARAVRRAARAVCAGLEERPGEVRLRCRSNRLVAALVRRAGGTVLDVRETRGLPWGSDMTAPIVAFPPIEVGLGVGCPGSTPEGYVECRLAAHDLDAAREALAEADPGGVASLRRGDLAFAQGDTRAAASHWARAHGATWDRLAAVRLCELDAGCVTGPRAEALYDSAGLPYPLRLDLLARRARALAFLDRPLEAERLLLSDGPGRDACAAAPELCRRVALTAMRLPFPAGAEALGLWIALPGRDRTDYETEVAVARAAAQAGAPLFAANVLAGVAGRAPPGALGEHLLSIAERYLEASDPIRAGVVHEFARAHAGKRGLTGPRWAAVERALAPRTRRVATSTAASASSPAGRAGRGAAESKGDDATLIAAAAQAAARARALTEGGRP